MLSAEGAIRLRYVKLCHATGVTLGFGYRGVPANLPRLHQTQSTLARAVSWLAWAVLILTGKFTLAASLRLLPKAPWLLARIAVEGKSAHLELLG
jgi:hypothetical protein